MVASVSLAERQFMVRPRDCRIHTAPDRQSGNRTSPHPEHCRYGTGDFAPIEYSSIRSFRPSDKTELIYDGITSQLAQFTVQDLAAVSPGDTFAWMLVGRERIYLLLQQILEIGFYDFRVCMIGPKSFQESGIGFAQQIARLFQLPQIL
jgi:hypothetical protein